MSKIRVSKVIILITFYSKIIRENRLLCFRIDILAVMQSLIAYNNVKTKTI